MTCSRSVAVGDFGDGADLRLRCNFRRVVRADDRDRDRRGRFVTRVILDLDRVGLRELLADREMIDRAVLHLECPGYGVRVLIHGSLKRSEIASRLRDDSDRVRSPAVSENFSAPVSRARI